MAVRGDAADLVLRAGAGVIAAPEDPAGIAAKVLELASLSKEELEAMGHRGKSFYFDQLALSQGVEAIAGVIKRSAAAF